MSQIATTIEQSKRLLAAGIDPESCDMWWTIRRPLKYDGWKLVYNGEPYVYLSTYKEEPVALAEFEIVPAWSLSRLWDICNDSEIGPFNFGGDSIESSEIVAKLVKWIILGIHDYEVIDEYLNEETRQEQSHANH